MLTSKTSHVLLVALVLAGAAAAFAADARPSARVQEAELLAVLKSDKPYKDKADACRLLARIATKKAVPTLAAMLGDEKLSHMARYALETIPDPAADVALRDALGKLKGLPRVGVIGSIGVRRDAKAVAALAKLLEDGDADTIQAAARALGKIGNSAAAKAMTAALADVARGNQVALCEGLFRCAESLAADGNRDEATAIYDGLRGVKEAHQVRAGALRGAVLMRGTKGLPLLVEAIRGDDYVLVAAAARIAMEMPDAEVTKALASELGKLEGAKRILMIQTLGKRGDAAAMPALAAAAKSGEKAARVAAIHALPMIGDAAAAPLLVQLMGDADGEVAKAAQECLAALAGPQLDAAIIAMLSEKEAGARRTAVELIARRRLVSAVPRLLKAAADDADPEVRVASIKTLGSLGGEAELSPLIAVLMKAASPAEMQAAEAALTAICIRQSKPVAGKIVILKAVYGALPDGPSADVTKKVAEIVKAGSVTVEASNSNFGDPAEGTVKHLRVDYTVDGRPGTGTVPENESLTIAARVTSPACTNALCAALAQAPTQPKIALLGILRSTRSPRALAALRAATTDANAQVKDAAVSLLCDWPDVEALPDVARLAKTATDQRVKILALRGYVRLIPEQAGPAAKKVADLKGAMALAERNEEKKLVLAALRGLATVDALALVTPHLANAALKEEASVAAVDIAEKVLDRHPAEAADALKKVAEATSNQGLAKRADTLLKQAQSKRGGR